MPITLGLNISSLRSQRQLARSSDELSNVFTRLSSGQRINKASDDAAGLAIADSLNADSRVFNQGVRNLNDGISVLNIADGALQELTNITFRLTELAEQAANGTLGIAQRTSLDEEAQALKAEYFRIAKTTEFNGRKLFEGDYGILSLQAGYGTSGSLSQGLGGDIGTGAFNVTGSYDMGASPRELQTVDLNGDGNLDILAVNRTTDSITMRLGQGDGSFGSAQSITTGDFPSGFQVGDFNGDGIVDLATANSLDQSVRIHIGIGDGTFQANVSYATGGPVTSMQLVVGDFNGDGIQDLAASHITNTSILTGAGDGTFSLSGSYDMTLGLTGMVGADVNNDGYTDLISSDVNSVIAIVLANGDGSFASEMTVSSRGDITSLAVADLNGDGNLDLIGTEDTATDIHIRLGNGDGTFQDDPEPQYPTSQLDVVIGDFNGDGHEDLVTVGNEIHTAFGRGDGTFQIAATLSLSGTDMVVDGDFNNDGVLDLFVIGSSNLVLLGESKDGVAPLLDFSLNSIADAKDALSRFQQKLAQLSTQRGQIGAFQSRIEVAETVLKVSAENFKAAESRIRDADIAQESSQLTRLNILQQSAAAVLGQANLQPQLVLQLLGQ